MEKKESHQTDQFPDGMGKYGIDPSGGIEFGIYTLGDHMPDPHTRERIPAVQRIHEIIELAQLSEQAGLDFSVLEKVIRIISPRRRIQWYWPQ